MQFLPVYFSECFLSVYFVPVVWRSLLKFYMVNVANSVSAFVLLYADFCLSVKFLCALPSIFSRPVKVSCASGKTSLIQWRVYIQLQEKEMCCYAKIALNIKRTFVQNH